jgi:hypothetical protein
MLDLARDKCGPFQVQDRVGDIARFADPAKGADGSDPHRMPGRGWGS